MQLLSRILHNGVGQLMTQTSGVLYQFWPHESKQNMCTKQAEIHHYHHHHLSLNREGRWGTTDDFQTSFLHFPLFSTAFWDLANSRPVHSLMGCFFVGGFHMSSHV